jgi:hypothetical protein
MSTADLRAAVEAFLDSGAYRCPDCRSPDFACVDEAPLLALIDQHHCDEGVRITPETLTESEELRNFRKYVKAVVPTDAWVDSPDMLMAYVEAAIARLRDRD